MSADDARQAIAGAAAFNPGDREPPAGVAEVDWRARRFTKNDVGNADRLRERHGGGLIFVPGIGWHAWDAKRWSREDGERRAQLHAQATALAIFAEARALDAGGAEPGEKPEDFAERVERHRKWAVTCGNSNKLTAMLREAAPHLTRRIDQLDQQPWLITLENGTLELPVEAYKPVKLRDHAPDDLITRKAPVAYDPQAKAPAWEAFIAGILPHTEVAGFVRRYLGSCLSGDISEQQLALLIGAGANGKGTLLTAVMHVLGDYALSIDFTSLLHNERRRGGDATPDIARLPGVRLVTASEPEQGARFSEAMLKQMTGEDRIIARNLNEDPFEFLPQFKLVLAANHRPQVRGQDEGIWRRLNVVPFDVVVPKEKRDPRLREKLRAEGPGILNWLIQGYLEWRARGLAPPAQVKESTAEYRAESDPVGEFLAAACETTPADAPEPYAVPAKELYAAYVTFCGEAAMDPWSMKAFGGALSERGFGKDKQGTIVRLGLRLTMEWIVAHAQKPSEKPASGGDGKGDGKGGDS